MKRIVIVGAGYAGIQAALTLHGKLRRDDVRITLIDKSEYHTLLTELHEIAGNRSDVESVQVPLHQIFQYTSVQLVRDVVTEVRPSENKVITGSSEYPYDYLVLAAGSRPTFFGIPGMEEHGLSLWSRADAERVREHIRSQFIVAAQTADAELRREMLTLVVCGAGFTGIELMGEIARWRHQLCREHGVDEREVHLIVVEAIDKILTVLPGRLSDSAMRYLKHLGVEVRLNAPIVSVTPREIHIKDGSVIRSRTMVWCGGVQGATLSENSGVKIAGRGRLAVNEFQQTDIPNIYSAGDQANGQPALVESAIQTADTAAHSIIAAIKGKSPKPHRANLHGVMVSIGRWWGVADLMGIRLTGILAIAMKHLVNMHYLWTIGGFELPIAYLKHQFYREELPRNLVEQQFVRRGQLFWLAPLRLYLGYMWFMQGLSKFRGGWWDKVILKASYAGAAAGSAAVDAATAATEVAGEAGGAGMSLIGPSTPGWYAWIVQNYVYPNALFAQRGIVATEIVLGILFALGAFTFIAALISMVLYANFMLSTGVNDYWYLVVAIAMMMGAGEVFGADYIIMPYLGRQWRYIMRNGRLKIWLWE